MDTSNFYKVRFCKKCITQSIFLLSDALVAAAASHDTLNKNEAGFKSSCDPDTCSISTTVPCNKGSRASSHISIPGLDWDSQVKIVGNTVFDS